MELADFIRRDLNLGLLIKSGSCLFVLTDVARSLIASAHEHGAGGSDTRGIENGSDDRSVRRAYCEVGDAVARMLLVGRLTWWCRDKW